jgi:hypothetical protein
MGKNGAIGIIIPLGHEAVHEIVHRRNLYSCEKSAAWDSIEEGDTAFLYDAEETRKLEGEAKVHKVSSPGSEELLRNIERSCLTGQEVGAQSGRAAQGKILLIEVKDAVKYSKGIVCPFEVPPGGLKVLDETYSKILEANS